MSYPICRDLQQQTRFFDGVLCRAEIQVNLSAGGDPKPVAAEIVSGSYFPVLGVGPALGRVIEPADDAAPGAGPVVVLSYDFWQAQFGGAADIVGRKVLIDNHPMTVVGVAAAGFRGVDVGAVPAFWIPTSMYADANLDTGDEDLLNSPTRWLQILARLRSGVYARAGADRFAAVVQGMARGQHASSRLPDDFGRPPPRVPGNHSRTHLRAPGPFASAPQPLPAALAIVRRHWCSARPRLPERRRTLPRPRFCTGPRDRHPPRSRRFPRPHRAPTPRR